jgi:hypothetical protein
LATFTLASGAAGATTGVDGVGAEAAAGVDWAIRMAAANMALIM